MRADIKLQQVYRRVQEWEEVTHNMWGKVSDRNSYIERAIQFTGNHIEYGRYMRRVCEEWPISTENAFTDPYLNHRAWVGHAACALAFNCPEDIVRQAWRFLTDEQKLLANKEASRAIADWRRAYIKDRGLRPDVAAEMLPGFDS